MSGVPGTYWDYDYGLDDGQLGMGASPPWQHSTSSMSPVAQGTLWLYDPPVDGSASASGSEPPLPSATPMASGSSSPQIASTSGRGTIGDLLSNLPSNYDAATAIQMRAATLSAQPVSKIPLTPKPFISTLHHLLASPANIDCMVWSVDGTCFVVHHNERLAREILTKHFQHGNISSFTRQLNVYEFRRLLPAAMHDLLDLDSGVSLSEYSGWTHPYFLRDDTSLLAHMSPRPSKARRLKKAEKEAAKQAAKSHKAMDVLRRSSMGSTSSTGSSMGSTSSTGSGSASGPGSSSGSGLFART